MAKVHCGDCRYWDQLERGGACRRLPPQNVLNFDGSTPGDATQGVWPITDTDDWCGEYQPGDPPAPF